jgi:hypothetical protein
MLAPPSSPLPDEIWLEILEWVIHVPFFFDTECTRTSFWKWTNGRSKAIERDYYGQAEAQRKNLSTVSKSWSSFALSRAHRYVVGSGCCPKARCIYLHPAIPAFYAQPTQWQTIQVVVESDNDVVVDVLRAIGQNIIQHPHMRRLEVLDMWARGLSSVLASFVYLTSLEVRARGWAIREDHKPITLPCVTTLQWALYEKEALPGRVLNLPSLLHLHLVGACVDKLEALVGPYRQTLKSVIFDLLYMFQRNEEPALPPWDFYPHLEELALKQFKPLLRHRLANHPLERFYMSELSTSTLHLLVTTSDRLRLVNVATLDWKDDGIQLHGLEKFAFETLVRFCQVKGVRLEDRYGLTAGEVRCSSYEDV